MAWLRYGESITTTLRCGLYAALPASDKLAVRSSISDELVRHTNLAADSGFTVEVFCAGDDGGALQPLKRRSARSDGGVLVYRITLPPKAAAEDGEKQPDGTGKRKANGEASQTKTD